ncbi:MAG: Bacteriohemerythrin [Mycoplasmataceae bacterium]|nr:MAG: Bacteriohemerythrin [Mycoplasmataceae bacterium]
MNDSSSLVCSQCNKKASYRDKLSKLWCYDCYWEQSEHNKPKGDAFTDSDIYRSCPFCGSGDICGIGYCIAKCGRCRIIDDGKKKKYKGSTYCSKDCADIEQREEKKEKSNLQQKKIEEIIKQIEELKAIESKYLTVKDYQKIKSLKKQLENLIKECEKTGNSIDKNTLEEKLEELEKSVSEQIRVRTNWLSKYQRRIKPHCSHLVYWPRAKNVLSVVITKTEVF